MHVQFVHFTAGATHPVQGFKAHGVRVVTLADGAGADLSGVLLRFDRVALGSVESVAVCREEPFYGALSLNYAPTSEIASRGSYILEL